MKTYRPINSAINVALVKAWQGLTLLLSSLQDSEGKQTENKHTFKANKSGCETTLPNDVVESKNTISGCQHMSVVREQTDG